MALKDMTGLEIVERLVEICQPRSPMSPELIDKALDEVGLPAAPLYRELLLRTDGLDLGAVSVVHVEQKDGGFLGRLAELDAPYIPIAFVGVSHFGWHREEKCWCRAASGPVRVRYPDEETMFRALVSFIPRFVPHVVAPARPRSVAPLADLVTSVPAERVQRPQAVSTRNRVHRVFKKAVKAPAPDDYRAFFDLCDGFEVNGLDLYGARDLANEQLDLDEEGYVEVGMLDDLALVYSVRSAQWQLVDSGSYEPDSDDDRYQTFTELIGTLLPQRLA